MFVDENQWVNVKKIAKITWQDGKTKILFDFEITKVDEVWGSWKEPYSIEIPDPERTEFNRLVKLVDS